jgi:uncharacterized paraquat-inducible protein A
MTKKKVVEEVAKPKVEKKAKPVYCYNCNAENVAKNKECTGCGADLTDNEEKK